MQLNELYKCDHCKLVMEAVDPRDVTPVCCGEAMKALTENSVDAAKEKHVPVIEKIDGGYKVKIGSVAHPMTPEHYIVAIELIADGQILRQPLTPTDQPEAVFLTKATSVKAREYCNLHGLWVANS